MPHEPERIRVALIDDHAIVRQGLEMLINAEPGLKVIGTTDSSASALKLVTHEQPDIILLDLDLGSESGIDLLPLLLATAPRARVILVTGARDPDAHLRAVQLGAMGVILKDQASETLTTAIKNVHAGGAWVDPALTARLLSRQSRPQQERDPEADKIASLTGREIDIIVLICEGLQNNDIGDRLKISAITVRNHLSTIYSKLGVNSRLELAIYAFKQGLAKTPGNTSAR